MLLLMSRFWFKQERGVLIEQSSDIYFPTSFQTSFAPSIDLASAPSVYIELYRMLIYGHVDNATRQ